MTKHSAFPWIWLVVMGIILTMFCGQVYRGISFESSILNLLPKSEVDPILEETIGIFLEKMNRKIVFLIGHPDEKKAIEAAQSFASRFEESAEFSPISLKRDSYGAAFYEFYFPHRYQLLTDESRALLSSADGAQKFLEENQKLLYSPFSGFYTLDLQRDPLLLFPRFLASLPSFRGNAQLKNDVLMVERGHIPYVLLEVEIAGDPFHLDTQQKINGLIQKERDRLVKKDSQFEMHYMGMIRFATFGNQSFRHDLSTIGVGSLLGILMLILFTFRSLKPLFLSFLTIGMGLLFAFTLSQLIFEKIHFLTLVFGASLIGVCVDYSFHFFAKHLFAEKTWNSRQAMITILPALVTGAFTSALGYLGLASTPFPGFHQIAVFSILGLMGSLGTVICWFPRLMQKKLPGKTPPYVFVVQKYLGFWQNLKGRHGFLLLPVLLVAGWGISFLKANDDIRALQRVPENLVVEQKWLEDLLGGFETARFILLEGKTSQDLLNLQEKFQPYLEKLQPDHLKKFISVSPYIPSINRQKEDRKLLGETLLNPKGWLGNEIRKMGFSEESIEEVNASLQNWQQGREDYLFPEAWLESEVSLSHRHLWLGKTKRGFASILLLDGVKGDENIQELAESWEGVYYHNRIKEISLLLKRFRIQASLWVALSYGLILFFLLWRYGLQKGILVFLGPVLSLVLTLGWLGISQQEINLFHILSFLLVLGIGIDYSIFMVEAKDPLLSTMVAIFLSATTTILSFGLLSLSEIPVLKTIGNTMLLGIAFSCLFSPLPMLSKIKLKSPNDLG